MHKDKKAHHKPQPPKNPEMAAKLAAAGVTPESVAATAVAEAPAAQETKAPVQQQRPPRREYTQVEKDTFNNRRRIKALEDKTRDLDTDINDLITTCQGALDQVIERDTAMLSRLKRLELGGPSVDIEGLKAELREELVKSIRAGGVEVIEALVRETLASQPAVPAQPTAPSQPAATAPSQPAATVPVAKEETLEEQLRKPSVPFYRRKTVQYATAGVVVGAGVVYGVKKLMDKLEEDEG